MTLQQLDSLMIKKTTGWEQHNKHKFLISVESSGK